MIDPLQAVLFPPRKPGWILRSLIQDWKFDFSYGFHAHERGHYRENEIRKSAYHALEMLAITAAASQRNERKP